MKTFIIHYPELDRFSSVNVELYFNPSQIILNPFAGILSPFHDQKKSLCPFSLQSVANASFMVPIQIQCSKGRVYSQ